MLTVFFNGLPGLFHLDSYAFMRRLLDEAGLDPRHIGIQQLQARTVRGHAAQDGFS